MSSTPNDVRYFPTHPQSHGANVSSSTTGNKSTASIPIQDSDKNAKHEKLEQLMAQEAAEYRDMIMYKRIYHAKQQQQLQQPEDGHQSGSALHYQPHEVQEIQVPQHRRTCSAPQGAMYLPTPVSLLDHARLNSAAFHQQALATSWTPPQQQQQDPEESKTTFEDDMEGIFELDL